MADVERPDPADPIDPTDPAGLANPATTGGLRLVGLTIGYRHGRRRTAVLTGLTALARRGELTVLLGPNGTGKSTLLRTLAGLQPPLAGRITLDRADLTALTPRERARRIGVVLTDRVDIPLARGRDLVALGRHPHTDLTGRLTDHDRETIDWAITAVGARPLADRLLDELSDGERQRLFVARALAQQPSVILLDEPSAFLDAPSRVALTALLRRLARDRDLAVVVSTHDLELALRVADATWLLDAGGTLHTGSPEELILDGRIAATFDSDELHFDPITAAFVPRPPIVGTARVRPDRVAEPTAMVGALERALRREGWQITATGPVDLEIAPIAAPAGFHGAADGLTTSLPDLPAALRWIRSHTAARPDSGWSTRHADPAHTTATLAGLADVGPYFAVELTAPARPATSHAPAPSGPTPSGAMAEGGALSAPVDGLYRPGGPLAAAVDELGGRLGTVERRVAASTLFLGYAARLWSIALGCWERGGTVPGLPADRLGIISVTSSPIRLLLTDPDGWSPTDPDDLATAARLLIAAVIDGHLRPLAAALRTETRIAPGLLWGNAASALVGATRILDREITTHTHDGPQQTPSEVRDRARRLGRLVDTVLATPPLSGAAHYRHHADGTPDLTTFLRRSCCLYYRTPTGGTCADCPLTHAPAAGHPRGGRQRTEKP
ncbi:ATP-binding cassette domain-containing protein [Frankia sp. AgPm24]|uniref:ATP-binding cassette domain-containing protein n=1 Tax=Frankia umida TaxID=573489 RepID=A0ABT0JV96_9ACTN|nr:MULTISPECIES: ATP-binding cassette domain-containing protein [Frankia]MCK9875142.1 ATP-binding cassette domain-containing protein [Frankia umida]MCK9921471.1 ATP-binding cassette domain-containing protein [Frankia sp. AgPm24]